MTSAAIEVAGLHKSFGTTHALDGLDLVVPTGQVAGFLGPNGSGKSTTIRVLLGLLRADAGTARLLGGDPWADAVALHSRLAYVPGDVTLWPTLTGGEAIDLLVRLSGRVADKGRKEQLLQRFELDPSKRARTYSKGNRQKVALVAALATNADLLMLDEPTSGLDPLMEQAFQEVVRERREEGCTVLLSSHILGEVEALADRVSIIRRGRTVTTGSLAELRRHTRTRVHAVTVDAPAGLADATGVADLVSEQLDGHADSRFTIDAEHLDAVIGLLHSARIHTLTVTPPSLDALFLRSYGGAAVPLDASELGEPAEARR
jgi:ABC-2 type transport system ATP-binding protein